MSKKNSPPLPVVLVTITGTDRPGITAKLMQILTHSKATILDIGQAVIHGQLSLSFLFQDHSKNETLKELLFASNEMKMKLEFKMIENDQENTPRTDIADHRYAVTLMSIPLTAKVLHAVTEILAKHACNIESIQKLSHQEFSCVELLVNSTKPLVLQELKKELLLVANKLHFDIALQEEGLYRKAKRLVVMDMDSTLIQQEVIDEFAKAKGVFEQVSAITKKAMEGNMSFEESLTQRCSFLKGLTLEEIDSVYQKIELTHGAETLLFVLKKMGYKIALISGGFTCIANRLKEKLKLDFVYANQMEFEDGVFTGKIKPPILNAQRKADLVDSIAQSEEISHDQIIAIGDGANDIPMIQKADLGIAFNAKALVNESADMSLRQKNISSILYLLGFQGKEVQQLIKKANS